MLRILLTGEDARATEDQIAVCERLVLQRRAKATLVFGALGIRPPWLGPPVIGVRYEITDLGRMALRLGGWKPGFPTTA